jgi:pantetheine-phosphate adenylyltransferase
VKKSNAGVVESFDKRIEAVRRFGAFFNPSLIYEVVPITDVYGPTAWDPNIQALVVSHETQEGAAAGQSHECNGKDS